jgi:hypothetical protein
MRKYHFAIDGESFERIRIHDPDLLQKVKQEYYCAFKTDKIIFLIL